MKHLVLSVLLILFADSVSSQGLIDLTLEERFGCQIKSLDEFLARFNGMELNPTITAGEYLRRKNILALMDYQMAQKKDSTFRQDLFEFVHAIENNSRPILDTDSLLFVDATCRIKYKGNEINIHLILQKERDKNEFQRWTIVGANGLQQAGILDTTKVRSISPVDHEVHFMGLTDIFKHHATEIMAYKGRHTRIDQLSVFLTMAKLGLIQVDAVENLTYYILQVPNYIFTIDEIARIDYNSGWLISSFQRLDDAEKSEYVRKLLGK